MKMKTTFSLLAMTWLFVSSGCRQTVFENEVRQIDSMMVVLDSVQAIHSRIDTSGYDQAHVLYVNNMSSVQRAYVERGDTMERDIAMMLAKYRELKKPLENFKRSYIGLGADIEFTRNQLIDLKHDIEHNLLDTNLVNRLMREESDAVTRIRMTVEQLRLSHETTTEKKQTIEPRVDSLLQALNNPL